MDTEDGQIFIKNLAYFVRTHEKALANALQLQRQSPKNASTVGGGPASPTSNTPSNSASTFAAALSLPYLTFTSQTIKPAKLTLTPHHLFYLLSRFEEMSIPVGPMNIRLENIHSESTNYVSFLSKAQRNKSRASDRDSMHSVSSIRSVMSGMSSLWSTLGLASNSAAKAEKQKAAIQEDLKYLYSAFTKIPCLRLAPDHKARLIAGYEEFPFDSAVPLFAFKNLSALEIYDVDFRQFYGWDRLAEQLRSLTVKRAGVDDPTDLLINVVLDDMDKRRKRSAKAPPSPVTPWTTPGTATKNVDIARSQTPPASPGDRLGLNSPQSVPMARSGSSESKSKARPRQRSASPTRPHSSRHGSTNVYGRNSTGNIRRSSGSSGSSIQSATPRNSTSNLLSTPWFPSTKWRFLRHLSLADNALTNISTASLAPLANTLQSFDLSANLFTEIPDSLASLTSLRALNLSNCMIESLHSLGRSPLPAITTLNLRSNRLISLAGVERLLSLERVDLRDNKLTDPTEVARLTGIPEIQEIYVGRNPFCKTHSNYRVTIFNLFRKTPGYAEDIVIDTTGPGYSERKQLVDRAPERPNVPVMKPPPEDDVSAPPPPPPKPRPAFADVPGQGNIEAQTQSARSHHRSRSDYGTGGAGSQRRRKPKRRIVELSQSEHAQSAALSVPPPEDLYTSPVKPQLHTAHTASEALTTVHTHPDHEQLPLINTALATHPKDSAVEFDVSSDLYKKKIEALRQDFGSTWLSALGDESWDSQTVGSFPERGFSPPLKPSLTRTPSQGIVSGGRTLG
ncbi:uncharacterized protein BDZ99DRAFT_187442 [Mytilinidion resinicola]|uniref:Leucine rich repeat domain-containing protein n=1 Tax=Mytilinidion resinicola TaxID=574789 RepID=A0A6A6Z447_9PEZI|nr:uncharacterized protein BDZ99DRAFT_187442 [Mytilinidion resinicola]KAF2814935.1 hypothetical protein BDZ99DRAFT_187442 [Mytilinidion resinicola]